MNIIILLGSNLGDRLTNLKQAITAIASFSTILQQSNIYQTAAWVNRRGDRRADQRECLHAIFSWVCRIFQ